MPLPINDADAAAHWEVAPGWDRPLLEACLREGRARVVKDGQHRTVYRIDAADKTLFVKHYRTPSWLHRVRHLLRASASRREWTKTAEVARRSIPTATPVAWGESRSGGLVSDNYFVTEGIPHAVTLEEFATDALPSLPPRTHARLRRRLIEGLAKLAADAHCAGVFHRDFHAGNVLLQIETDGKLETDPGAEVVSDRFAFGESRRPAIVAA